MIRAFRSFVIAGLDPAIYPSSEDDVRVEPVYDIYNVGIILRLFSDLLEAAMDGSQGRLAWKETSYSRWKAAVNKRLVAIYGITIVDSGVDDEYLTVHWEMKQSPYEFVDWFGVKYDLDPISSYR